jgi:hypothetical protein
MILAGFADRHAMLDAARRLRAEGLAAETYSPMPPDAEDSSPIPLVMLLFGLFGAFGSFAMQAYATTAGYRINVGGRPNLFWPAYVPFAFETGVLFAIAGGFISYLVVNRLPHLYDPIDESEAFRAATRDGWFVAISGDTRQGHASLEALRPTHVEDLPE